MELYTKFFATCQKAIAKHKPNADAKTWHADVTQDMVILNIAVRDMTLDELMELLVIEKGSRNRPYVLRRILTRTNKVTRREMEELWLT